MMKATTTSAISWGPPLFSQKSLALIDLILLCSLLGGCHSFSAATRNNEGVVTACVDKDLSNGDSCTSSDGAKEPGDGPSEK
jgi:hypothetical protein